VIGVKVWVFKGEVLEHDPMALDKRLAGESGPAGEGGGRDRDRERGPRRDRREQQNA
jgi:small subunit ribosomal protein S3